MSAATLHADDRQRLRARYEKELAGARAFLLAEDVAESERARRMRIRTALVFLESYRELPLLAWPRELVDGLVTLEQAFVLFRQRHARMVERVIGRRAGTGGSIGVDYLDRTALQYRVFDDIWAVRTLLLPAAVLPPVERADVYGFRAP
jgi:tryptophan 2,3-dioxygenase